MQNRILLFVMLLPCFNASALQQDDSVKTNTTEKVIARNVKIRSTVRIHDKGMFSYGGRICTDNPAFDINFIYERKTFGLLVFKAVDLVDQQSPNNFMLAVLYKNFKLTKQLTFTPNIGAFIEQQYEFIGEGSDVALIGVTAFKFNSHFTVDHTMMFGNFVVEPASRDWVNRFRLLFTSRHLDITGFVWHNNHTFDSDDYGSAALSIGYNRIKLSENFNLNFSITDMVMASTSDEKSIPKGNKVMFTTAIQFVK